MAIHNNSKVSVIEGWYKGKTGKVERIYNDLEIAIVSFDDTGDVAKVRLASMVEILVEEKQEPKIEFMPEGAKKISRSEFHNAIIEAAQPDEISFEDLLRNLSALIIGNKIIDSIFKDEDFVIITADELIEEIWSMCDPKRVSESIDRKLSISQSIVISMTAVSILLTIVPMIFDGSENA